MSDPGKKDDKYEHGFENCAFGYLATAEQPCWGQVHIIDELCTDDDVFYVYGCYGHECCSTWLGTSDDENRRRYITKHAYPVATYKR